MEKEKLSAREAALISQARREAETLKSGNPPPGGAERAATPAPAAAEERPKASPAERLAQLMAEERAETARRKTKIDRKSTRLNSSHGYISYAVFCLKKKK